MNTKIIEVDAFKPDEKLLIAPAKKLRENGTVIFPTETVYGLGANALEESSVKKIYEAKGRPSDNPLIVHISRIEDFQKYSYIKDKILDKVSVFSPGPITFVLKKRNCIPDVVTAGRDTVGIRFPAHPVARQLIDFAEIPVAAPSANLSGKPSPTLPEHVIEDMNGRVDYIIVSDKLQFGLESTILNISDEKPVLLRPGPIPPEKIIEVFGEIEIPKFIYGTEKVDIALAPGMKYRHYSPEIPVILIENSKNMVEKCKHEYKKFKNPIIFIFKEHENDFLSYNYSIIGSYENYYEIGVKLFEFLRKFDNIHDGIIIEGVEDKNIGIAIMNRLRKAASKIL